MQYLNHGHDEGLPTQQIKPKKVGENKSAGV
jgi:hypothetical protein